MKNNLLLMEREKRRMNRGRKKKHITEEKKAAVKVTCWPFSTLVYACSCARECVLARVYTSQLLFW